MRFLHTSDWHLGKSLKQHDLSQAQQVALDAIIDVAIDRDVGAFVIAGDVFDRAFPSVEDVRCLNAALTRLHDAGIPIICTAGNHDEGARLAAYANLLAEQVTVVGEFNQVGASVVMHDEYGPVVFYPLPYLDPDAARRSLAPTPGEMLERSHEAVMTEAMNRIQLDLESRRAQDPSTRAVVIAHAFVIKGQESPEQSESERPIAVGGVPSVPTAVFDGVDYVALGHIHGPRTIQESEPTIRYSGSLLRYSISEAHHEKTVTIVEMGPDGRCELELVPIPQPARMFRLMGDFEEIISGTYAEYYDDFVEIKLTDKRIPDNHYAQLTYLFSRILSVSFERDESVPAGMPGEERTNVAQIPPIDLLRTFFAKQINEDMNPQMEAILIDVLEEASKAEGT